MSKHKEQLQLEPLANGAMHIYQNRALPCFSADACLLAGFCYVREGMRIADLGTGTGIIPLLLQLRQSDMQIKALELMPEMYELAKRSFEYNHLPDIEAIRGDLKEAAQLLGGGYDMVCCNPPYYAIGSGRISEDKCRAAARNEIYCRLADVIKAAAEILKPQGRLCLSMLYSRKEELCNALQQGGFSVSRLYTVADRAGSEPWLCLAEGIYRPQTEILTEEKAVSLYTVDNEYSEEIKQLYAAWIVDLAQYEERK